jgi:hypothetical protein
MMTDPFLRDSAESSRQRIRAVLKVLAIIAAIVVLVVPRSLVRAGGVSWLSRSGQAWVALALGVFFSLHVWSDIRRGRTHDPTERYEDPLDDIVRSAPHPGFFWAVIAVKGALSAVLVIGGLAGLLGLWKS